MDEQEYPYWVTVGATELLKFSDLPDRMARAQYPSDDESWDYAAARINLDKELPECVHRGELIVRNASGLGVHTFPHGQALKDAIVLPQDLAPFLNARGFGLRRTKVTNPDRVLITDLANEISRQQADAFPGWAKDGADNDTRRDIAAAVNVHGYGPSGVPGILPHIVRMTAQGLISPRSAFNGMPANDPANDIDGTWYLSPTDAEEVRRVLLSAAQMPTRQDLNEAGHTVEVKTGAANLSTAKSANVWDEHELRRLLSESRGQGWAAKDAAIQRRVSRQMIQKMLKKAKEQFGPRKADAFSPRSWPSKK